MTPVDAASRLIVALDVPAIAEADRMIAQLGDTVSFYKIGPWLLHARGVDGLMERLAGAGKRIFLDCKMYDIGETVREGVRRAAERGVGMVTVHGDGAILRAALEGRAGSDLKILAVSVLTSLDDAGLREMGIARPVDEIVEMRVRRAVALGCDGVIAAPRDAPRIRRLARPGEMLLVTPGVRPSGAPSDDHKRGGTPSAAIAGGSDYLVVGRPVIRAPDPAAAARALVAEMRAAFSDREPAAAGPQS